MAASYLTLTNELLRELNEVILTSANFASATGIQQHAKDCINRAYLDIANAEPKWPFLSAGESGNIDPMYGNVYVETVAGTRFYELKEVSSNLTTDYGAIDWSNFYITTIGVEGETTPYVSKNLKFLTIEDWKNFRRASENADDADQQTWGEPAYVIRSPDSRKFGLSPIPKQTYRVWFYAWNLPTELVEFNNEIVFPNVYKPVLMARARYYVWQFKDNPQAAAFALDDYNRGIRTMRSNLLNPSPKYFSDDRLVYT